MSSYELEASLGSGPGSTTWRAVSKTSGSFGQQVVLATVSEHTIKGEPVSLDNLLGISELWHPNLAKVFNVGRNGGQVFVAFEFVQGISLHEMGQHVPRWQVLRMLGIACKALAYLHERGLYHGGVNSKRVMLSESGWVKLRGAGLVKVDEVSRVAEGLTERCKEQDRRSVVKMIDELALADDPRAAIALRGLRQSRPAMHEVGDALMSAAAIIGAASPAQGWQQATAGSRNAA
jgi:serine/threonine protein kinase